MMTKGLLWGGVIAMVGIGLFVWTAKDTLFLNEPLPTSTPIVSASIKPTLPPSPSSSPSNVLQEAQNALQQGQVEYATTLLKNTESTEGKELLLQALIQQKDYDTAEALAKELVQNQQTQEYFAQYVKVLLLQGNTAEAEIWIPKLSNTTEKSFYILLIAVQQGDHDQVRDLAKTLSESDEYETVGKGFLDVYTTYESFRDGSPHYLTAMLANVLKTLEFHNLAIETIKPTLKEFPEYRDAWLVIGNSYLALKKFDVAERMLEKAVSLDPTHPVSPYLLGVTLYELGQTDDALLQLKNAQKNGFTPKEQISRIIGDIYFAEENFEEALEYYQFVINEGENPTLQDFSKSIYIALQELNTPTLGRSFAETAQQIFQSNPEAKALEGLVLLKEGNTRDAILLLSTLKKEHQTIPEIQLYLGQAYEEDRDFDNAFQEYKSCYELISMHPISLECGERYETLRARLQDE